MDPNAPCSYECIVLGECTSRGEIEGGEGTVPDGEEDMEIDEGDGADNEESDDGGSALPLPGAPEGGGSTIGNDAPEEGSENEDPQSDSADGGDEGDTGGGDEGDTGGGDEGGEGEN